MDTQKYRELWKEAIRLCELESNKEEVSSFVNQYYDKGSDLFEPMDDRTLLLTFVGLVVYEQKFHLRYGSTTPAAFCYQEMLNRVDSGKMDKEFIYDVGDWAAEYSDNGYVPMGNYRGYGPRRYFDFLLDYNYRIAVEQEAKEKRIEKEREEGRKKVEAAKQKHQERLRTIQQLKEKTVDESLSIIEASGKSVFYYIELIEEYFKTKSLTESQMEKILSMIPSKSTKHNIRRRELLEAMIVGG